MSSPARIKIVATPFLLVGIINVASFIIDLIREGTAYVDTVIIAAFWISVGVGLLRASPMARVWARFTMGLLGIGAFVVLIGAYTSPDSFNLTWTSVPAEGLGKQAGLTGISIFVMTLMILGWRALDSSGDFHFQEP